MTPRQITTYVMVAVTVMAAVINSAAPAFPFARVAATTGGVTPTAVTAVVASTRVKVNTTVMATGTVTPSDAQGRPVIVQFATATGWRSVRVGEAGPTIRWACQAPSGSLTS